MARRLILCALFAASAARAQSLPPPSPEALGTGVNLSGQMPADGPALLRVPVLAGDAVEVSAQGTGAIELALFDPAGTLLGRTQGVGASTATLRASADGVTIVSVLAPPGTAYSLTLRRVVTARPAPLPVDPAWGSYARLAGERRRGKPFTIGWRWEVPGQILIEEWTRTGKEKVIYTTRITRGDDAGTLRMHDGKREWPGTVDAEGSVTWTHGTGGMFALPFRVALLEDGRLRRDYLKSTGETRGSDWYLP